MHLEHSIYQVYTRSVLPVPRLDDTLTPYCGRQPDHQRPRCREGPIGSLQTRHTTKLKLLSNFNPTHKLVNAVPWQLQHQVSACHL